MIITGIAPSPVRQPTDTLSPGERAVIQSKLAPPAALSGPPPGEKPDAVLVIALCGGLTESLREPPTQSVFPQAL